MITAYKYAFVLVNYNNTGYTISAIQSIRNWSKDSLIIIVDNKSNDSQREKLIDFTKEEKHVEIILEKINHGYFRGINQGLIHIQSKQIVLNFIIVGNNDLIFNRSIQENLDCIEELGREFPVLSPRIISKDKKDQNPHVKEKLSNLRKVIYKVYFTNYFFASILNYVNNLFRHFLERKDQKEFAYEGPIFLGYGACYILTEKFFKKYKLLDDSLFLMGEEALLTNQLREKGDVIYYYPKIIVDHEEHASVESLHSKKLYEITKESYKIYKHYL